MHGWHDMPWCLGLWHSSLGRRRVGRSLFEIHCFGTAKSTIAAADRLKPQQSRHHEGTRVWIGCRQAFWDFCFFGTRIVQFESASCWYQDAGHDKLIISEKVKCLQNYLDRRSSDLWSIRMTALMLSCVSIWVCELLVNYRGSPANSRYRDRIQDWSDFKLLLRKIWSNTRCESVMIGLVTDWMRCFEKRSVQLHMAVCILMYVTKYVDWLLSRSEYLPRSLTLLIPPRGVKRRSKLMTTKSCTYLVHFDSMSVSVRF